MSWLVEVPKTMEYIVEHPTEVLLFIRPVERCVKGQSRTAIETREVKMMTFGGITECLECPDYILIRIKDGALE